MDPLLLAALVALVLAAGVALWIYITVKMWIRGVKLVLKLVSLAVLALGVALTVVAGLFATGVLTLP